MASVRAGRSTDFPVRSPARSGIDRREDHRILRRRGIFGSCGRLESPRSARDRLRDPKLPGPLLVRFPVSAVEVDLRIIGGRLHPAFDVGGPGGKTYLWWSPSSTDGH